MLNRLSKISANFIEVAKLYFYANVYTAFSLLNNENSSYFRQARKVRWKRKQEKIHIHELLFQCEAMAESKYS